MTPSPGRFSTGFDSPVSIASLTLVAPSITTPSTGTFSPGRTRTRSPGVSRSTGTSSVPPSLTRCASDGMTLTSSSSALDAPRTERISTQCPRSMISIKVASSQKNPSPPTMPRTTAEL